MEHSPTCSYEAQRRDNIARNQARLAGIGITTAARKLFVKPICAPSQRPCKRAPAALLQEPRRSSRVSALPQPVYQEASPDLAYRSRCLRQLARMSTSHGQAAPEVSEAEKRSASVDGTAIYFGFSKTPSGDLYTHRLWGTENVQKVLQYCAKEW